MPRRDGADGTSAATATPRSTLAWGIREDVSMVRLPTNDDMLKWVVVK